MATNKQKTFDALNGAFLMSNSKINEDYLNETLQIFLLNERPLYDAMHNTRQKPESVAWTALMFSANDRLKNEEYPAKYFASSEQLKKWLSEFGRDYETIADTVEFIKAERLERKEWDEKQKEEGEQNV